MPASRRPLALLVAGALAVTGLLAAPTAAFADTRPAKGTPATVSTDSLPAPQINGVVWTQVVIGDTVYAGGRFSRVRKAGEPTSASGVRRSNMLAYDIRTGELLPGFAPGFNSEVRSLAVSSDKRTIYAVGNFTAVNGAKHTRIAAIDAVTGRNRTFKGSLNSLPYTVAVKGGTVYAGGQFTSASGKKRTRLAAFSTTGSLKSWRPSANRAVQGIAVSPSGTSVVVGGHFSTMNGKKALGSARVSSGTGRSNLSWAVNKSVTNSGPDAAIYSVSSDSNYVYLSGYSYHPTISGLKRLEGLVAAKWSGGGIHWLEDCKGDTYDSFPIGDVVYTASHAHDCSTTGGFKQTKPIRYNHSLAFTKSVEGTVKKQTKKQYTNFGGKPAPGLLDWYPAWTVGTYTGLKQAVWSVSGDSRYVVYGGEFKAVNGNAQQGLARFAVSSIAPNADGPRLSGSAFTPTVSALGGGKVKISWKANFDRDNKYLQTQVLRYQPNGSSAVACTVSTPARYYWSRPTYSCTDTTTVGSQVTYKLRAVDPFGNRATGDGKAITVK
ncbi:hypothetical protein [Amnibacterium endophyticum]|uniref:Fibronectin type-III domain-containing protein n=1 Tax=Amnibacterium endophyticum TaxID=2109337 RepID=A0ABW4LCZ3_9MICO